jgi:PIN domain nuclease of toxin-antitoxin system
MNPLVVDTHSAIWYLGRSPRLSSTARTAICAAIDAGEPVFISAVSVAEVTYLVEKGRLTPQQLLDLVSVLHRPDSGFRVAPFDLAIAEVLAGISRQIVPDMPDRMIAATARHLGLSLVTVDAEIRQAGIPTIW